MSGDCGESIDTCYIAKSKAKSFHSLFLFVAKIEGGPLAARELIGIGSSTLDRLKNEGLISRYNARKILSTYNKLKEQK